MAAIAAICFLSCSSRETDGSRKPVLTVSQAPQKYILEGIVGDLYDIHILIPPSADAETFDPSMQTISAVGESEVFFPTGLSGIEPAIVARIKTGFPDLKIVDTLSGLALIRGTHSAGDADPHVFSSARNLKIIARNMLRAMEEEDPANAAVFRQNYASLVSTLDSLDAEAARALVNAPRSFAVWHPSLSYFARDYGLNQFAFEADGKEASPAQFRHSLDAVKASDARIMLTEAAHGTQRCATTAAEAGLKTVEINLNTEDWPAQFRHLFTSLAER